MREGSSKAWREDRGASPEAIQKHYDVGNDFYELWLDPTMSYSSALWLRGDESLHQAQLNKLDWVGKAIAADGARKVLDIGCGWGGLARRLVSSHGISCVTGLTLSPRQSEFAVAANAADTIEGIDIRLESWAEHRPVERYDSIVSIEAFEAFARPEMSDVERLAQYRRFFTACHEMLAREGILVLQVIAYGSVPDRPHGKSFFAEVFPESDCPRLTEMLSAAHGLFELRSLRNDRLDYARTLNLWLRALKYQQDEAIAIVGLDTVQFYKKYLALSAIGFKARSRTLDRMVFSRL